MSAQQGTGHLVRLVLRRDRFLLPAWVLAFSLFPIAVGSSLVDLYPTAAEQRGYFEETASNPSYVALFGPAYSWEIGSLVAQRMSDMVVIVALISLLTVIRHTRAEEESGRRELLAATSTGRLAPLTASLLVTVLANLLLGVIVTIGLIGLDLPAAGSVAAAGGMAVAGIVFAAAGALVAQLSTGARAARGLGIALLALAYLLRLVGDSADTLSWLSWLSPLHWAGAVRPYAGERWWLFALPVALAVLAAAAAYALAARRDLGAGLIAERLGPPAATPALAGPFALAWRMHRGMLVAWTLAFAVAGALFGGVARDAGENVGDNEGLRDVVSRMGGGAALSDAFLASLTSILGLIAAGYAIQTVLRLQSEEVSGRAEPVLATAAPRLRWAASHLLFTVLGPTAALLAYGLLGGITYGASGDDGAGEVPRVLAGAAVQLPAVWVLGALTVALFGIVPRAVAASWVAFALCFLFGQIGAIFDFPQALLDISPYTHLPRLPGGTVDAVSLVLLAVVAALLGAIGLAGLRRRDIPVG